MIRHSASGREGVRLEWRFGWSGRLRWSAAGVTLATLLACGVPSDPGPESATPAPLVSSPLVDATAASGLDFVHRNGSTGSFYIVEIMGSGAALLDCDDDGDLDLLLRQGGRLDGVASGADDPTDRLLRNDLELDAAGGRRPIRWTDVTAESGLDRPGYGMGVATGDFDGDGRTDLYLTNFGPNRLLRALGDCRFEDVTESAGASDDRWSIAATFFDYDRDGRLDLYVGNYLELTIATARPCFGADADPDYCGPLAFPPAGDRLLRNLGGGRFEDTSEVAGIRAAGDDRTLGAIAFDADRDGWLDLFVGHDAGENHLWRNRGDGTFSEEGAIRGVAVNGSGVRTGDMGVEVADFDGDAAPDLVSTHLLFEGMGYWTSDESGGFRERAASAGVLRATLGGTGFGTALLDLENDGWPDLYVANGDVHRIPGKSDGGGPRFDQPDRLLSNDRGRISDVSASTSAVSGRSEVGRGVAAGDLDNDGDADLVLANNAGPARILLSRAAEIAPWVGVRLLGPEGRLATSAEAVLVCAGGRLLWRRAATDGSYASASDPRVLFGLAGCDAPIRLEVRWPDGSRERYAPPAAGAYREIRQGKGDPIAGAERTAAMGVS